MDGRYVAPKFIRKLSSLARLPDFSDFDNKRFSEKSCVSFRVTVDYNLEELRDPCEAVHFRI